MNHGLETIMLFSHHSTTISMFSAAFSEQGSEMLFSWPAYHKPKPRDLQHMNTGMVLISPQNAFAILPQTRQSLLLVRARSSGTHTIRNSSTSSLAVLEMLAYWSKPRTSHGDLGVTAFLSLAMATRLMVTACMLLQF
jgi:hypothetical protein